MSSKRHAIDRAKAFLHSMGIPEAAYIVSLQGPTFIFVQGVALTGETKDTLKSLGVDILGG